MSRLKNFSIWQSGLSLISRGNANKFDSDIKAVIFLTLTF